MNNHPQFDLPPLAAISPDDKLFLQEEFLPKNACLNGIIGGWIAYIDGYKDAADILVLNAIGRQKDVLVYPIVFLYRQHFELSIKHIIYTSNKILGCNDSVPIIHFLNDLWNYSLNLLNRIFQTKVNEVFSQVSRLLDEFSKIDPNSDAFRYPTNKRMRQSIVSVAHVDLRNVMDVSGKLSGVLFGIQSALDDKFVTRSVASGRSVPLHYDYTKGKWIE